MQRVHQAVGEGCEAADSVSPARRTAVDDQRPTLSIMFELCDDKADPTEFADVPRAHWARIRSTNPIGGLNKE